MVLCNVQVTGYNGGTVEEGIPCRWRISAFFYKQLCSQKPEEKCCREWVSGGPQGHSTVEDLRGGCRGLGICHAPGCNLIGMEVYGVKSAEGTSTWGEARGNQARASRASSRRGVAQTDLIPPTRGILPTSVLIRDTKPSPLFGGWSHSTPAWSGPKFQAPRTKASLPCKPRYLYNLGPVSLSCAGWEPPEF